MTPWTVARQAPMSMECSRQEYWSGLPFSTPRDLPHPGIKPASLSPPAFAGTFFTTVPPGKPLCQNYKKWQCYMSFPGGSDGKMSAYNAGDRGSIPGSGRSPGEGNGNPLQYSCLEHLMDGGAWLATVHGVAKSRTQLSDFTITLTLTLTRASD